MLSEQIRCSRTARRRIVVIYYAATLAFGYCAWDFLLHGMARTGWSGFVTGFFPGFLLSWLALSPGLLGGVHAGGLVRPFSPRYGRTAYNAPLTELFLVARHRHDDDHAPADERDIAVRDHAHYLALSVIRLVVLLLAVVVWSTTLLRVRWLPGVAALGCYALLILAMTLPQAILIWTEPDPEPDLQEEIAPSPAP